MSNIIDKVADCLIRAGSTFREDQKEAYRKAITDEQIESSCWVMKQVLDNALAVIIFADSNLPDLLITDFKK